MKTIPADTAIRGEYALKVKLDKVQRGLLLSLKELRKEIDFILEGFKKAY